jgi:hypothetical protein
LTDQNVSGSEVSPSEGVHFVNLDTFDEDDGAFGFQSAAASSSKGAGSTGRTDRSSRKEEKNSSRSERATSSSSTVAVAESERKRSSSGRDQSQGRMFSKARDPIEVSMGSNGKVTGLKSLPSSQFIIPELPAGKLLTINILSTWGDPHYVGLMGIDIFSSSGHMVRLSNPESQVWADPADINVLPEYGACSIRILLPHRPEVVAVLWFHLVFLDTYLCL